MFKHYLTIAAFTVAALSLNSCDKKTKDETTPDTQGGNSTSISKIVFSTTPGDTDIYEINTSENRLSKLTSIESGIKSRTTQVEHSGSNLFITTVTSSKTYKDTLKLDANSRIKDFDDITFVYNTDGYPIKALEGNSVVIEATYSGGNLISEDFEGDVVAYEYYSDKIDPMFLNAFFAEDDGFLGRSLLKPFSGKTSKNLLKKITYDGSDVYELSYEFDSKGFPKKVIVKNGSDTNTAYISVQ